jgi:AcrR family transcriptional regulator
MSREERAAATRERLLAAARELFAERGYGAVGTEELVRHAEVTRGALYHHFRDKQHLFLAVHERMEGELVESIGSEIAGIDDPEELLRSGIRSFLDAVMDPAVMQITLVDAPAVLGWVKWREIDAKYGLGLITAGLTLSMDAGFIPRQPVEPLAHLLLGAMGEAAMVIANSDDPAAARGDVEPPLIALLEGLSS